MPDFPAMIAPVGHVEPAPRRVRAFLDGVPVVDTVRARYVWEWPNYPQYYVPLDDVDPACLVDDGRTHRTRLGEVRRFSLSVGGSLRPGSVRVHTGDVDPRLTGLARVAWDAPDAWFEEDEEDEEIFVHPRNPYTRVDAVRSNRPVRIELDGLLLADAPVSVMVFETGLPTRYYVDRTSVDFTHLEPSITKTPCPYKGRTSSYWSVRSGSTLHEDLGWAYDFPTRAMAPIAGLMAFYNEKVDISVDGERLERPVTHFFA